MIILKKSPGNTNLHSRIPYLEPSEQHLCNYRLPPSSEAQFIVSLTSRGSTVTSVAMETVIEEQVSLTLSALSLHSWIQHFQLLWKNVLIPSAFMQSNEFLAPHSEQWGVVAVG